MERKLVVTAPYDKTDPDPKKNYGIHPMELRFYVIGGEGVVQFVYYTAQHLPHVADRLVLSASGKHSNLFHGVAADLGYHSPTPMYEGQGATPCHLLKGGTCYYDGSGLNADPLGEALLSGGSEAVWPMLEDYYRRTFLGTQRLLEV